MTDAVKVKKPVKKSTSPKKRRGKSLDRRKARAGWFFVLPFVLGFLFIYLPIIFDSIRFSFNEIQTVRGGGYVLNFVGWANYKEALFVNPDFVRILVSGLTQLILDIPSIVIFSLFMAVLLNQKMFGRAAFRAIFFIPVILSTGIIDQIDQSNTLMSYMNDSSSINTGTGNDQVAEILSVTDISALFGNMKIGTELLEYVTSLVNNIYNIINRSGVQMLIFLAGLQSISPAIYESCQIDGATAWETFWKITFPMISPMILVNAVYTVIDSFTSESNQVMAFINGIYQSASGGNVLSSAMAWMYFLLVMAMIGLVVAVLSAYIFYQRRD